MATLEELTERVRQLELRQVRNKFALESARRRLGLAGLEQTQIYLLRSTRGQEKLSGTLMLKQVANRSWSIDRRVRTSDGTEIEHWSGKAKQVKGSLFATFSAGRGEASAKATYALAELGIEGTFETPGHEGAQEAGALITISWLPDLKQETLGILRVMNLLIARARREADAGNWDEAADAAGTAIGHKKHALLTIPGIDVDGEGFLLRFRRVYEQFSAIDDKIEDLTRDSNLLWGRDRSVLDHARPKVRKRVEKRVARCLRELAEAISGLEDLRDQLPWFPGDDAPDLLNDLIDALKAIKDRLDNEQPLGTGRGSALERVRALKRNFLVEVSDSLPLWDLYELFRELDKYLEWASGMIRSGRVRGRQGRFVKRYLELAEAIKQKLEGLLSRTPADQGPRPGAPPRPTPPEPDYPPGSEDLPPFPPDDHG